MEIIVRIFAIVILFSLPLNALAEEKQAVNGEVRDVFKTNIPSPGQTPDGLGQTAIQAILQGVGLGRRNAFAVINGQIYRGGEEKQGIKVVKIRKQEVDILVNGIPSTLRLVALPAPKETAPVSEPAIERPEDSPKTSGTQEKAV